MSSKPSVQLANALGPSNQALAPQETVVWARMVHEERWPQEPRHPALSHPVPHTQDAGAGLSGDHGAEQQNSCFSSASGVVYYLGVGLPWANFITKAPS